MNRAFQRQRKHCKRFSFNVWLYFRLVDEGFSIDDSEEVAMLHNAEEDVCRKHLKSFQQLAEIGFPSKDVHQALIASSFDHQKALEQLIG